MGISLRQLRSLGFGDGAVTHRIGAGLLHPLHRGVYAVGHAAVSQQGAWLAAVMAGPEGAVLSHRSAAALWELLPEAGERISITCGRHLASTARIRVHNCRLEDFELAERFGVPVSSVPRTLLDVAAVALIPAINEMEVRRLATPAALLECVRSNPRRRGVARLRATIPDGPAMVRSELERRFLALVRKAGLPLPETGVRMQLDSLRIEVDCMWRARRVIVELDSRRYHDTAIAFERDRARDRRLQAAGWQVIRVTWSQLQEPQALLADLRHLLLGRTQRFLG